MKAIEDKIITNFRMLKKAGLKAKNPDQSSAMFVSFQDDIYTCRWKGFRKKDIKLMFKIALKRDKTHRGRY